MSLHCCQHGHQRPAPRELLGGVRRGRRRRPSPRRGSDRDRPTATRLHERGQHPKQPLCTSPRTHRSECPPLPTSVGDPHGAESRPGQRKAVCAGKTGSEGAPRR